MSEPGYVPNPCEVSVTYCPVGDATTMRPCFSPERLRNAPSPANIPVDGNVTAEVKPALRSSSIRRSEVFNKSAARTHVVVNGRNCGPCSTGMTGSCAPNRGVAGASARGCVLCAGVSGKPTVLRESISPGYTVTPWPSMTQASFGISMFSPTASMRPLRSSTVPFSSTGPLTVTMRAPRSAIGPGA